MSVGQEHCKLEKYGTGLKVACKHCDWTNLYTDAVVGKRMASNHIVKKHPDIAKPASQAFPSESSSPAIYEKRPYVRKPKSAAGVNFCPCCGTNLNAIRVALSL